MSMRVLIIGANGQLGWELSRRGARQKFDIVALDLPDLDITDRSSVEKAVTQSGVSLVINAAAYTAVDKAESEPDQAFNVNATGSALLARSCAESDIPLIHISTDYVFDGNKGEPYRETDPVRPIGVYGRSKAAGEDEIRKCHSRHIILRTAWLYGINGHNFVKTMLRIGKVKEILNVVCDQRGCPTFAGDLAEAILVIADNIRDHGNLAWGTYHCCGNGSTTWHGFAEKIFELARKHDSFAVREVVPISTAEYPMPARRPVNSVLDCALLTETFGIRPKPWQRSLAEMIRCLLTD